MFRQLASASKRLQGTLTLSSIPKSTRSSTTRTTSTGTTRTGIHTRHLSSAPPAPPSPSPTNEQPVPNAPFSLTKEMAFCIQKSTELFINHGLGMQRLQDVAKEAGDIDTLVSRWQRMMEAYLGTQVHVLAGLGYPPNENGLHLYNQHVAMYMQNADPDTQEELRLGTRDLWRTVLATAFHLSVEEIADSEMDIVAARNTMHKVSQKMQTPEILESIALKCGKLESTGNAGMDMAMKHQVVQDTLVHDVYLGGEPSLVEECGFEKGEKGYVFMQCVMAEHQNDPLVSQYVGAAMMQILKSAGIDMSEIEKAAKAMK